MTSPYPRSDYRWPPWTGNRQDFMSRYVSWVADAIAVMEQCIAAVRPRVVRRTGEEEFEKTTLKKDHPLSRLLANPVPIKQIAGHQYRSLQTIYLLTQGNFYAVKDQEFRPRELWPLEAHLTYMEKGKNGLPSRYAYYPYASVEPKFFPADRVLHIKRPNPIDPLGDGLSPIGQHLQAIELHNVMQQARNEAFVTGVKPGIVFSTDQLLDDRTVSRLEARVAQKWSGHDKWNRPLFLESGLKPLPYTLKPVELDFLESSKFSRDEVLAMYRVPLALLGVGDTVSGLGLQTWLASLAMFTKTVCDPHLANIAAQETAQLAVDWGDDLVVEYATTQPTDRNQDRADEAVDRREAIRSVNEIRQARGMKPLEGRHFDDPAWRPIVPSGSDDPAPDAAPTDQGTAPRGPRPTDTARLASPTAGDRPTR